MPLSSRERPFQASGPNIETNIKLLNIQHSSTLFIEKKGFYCATLCVNAVFAVARCPSVCLSVRPSRSCIVFRRLKISSNFILGSVAPSFHFFDPVRRYHIPRGTPSLGRKIHGRGWENFAIFDSNHRFSRKRYEIGPWLLWNVNRKS